MKKHIFLIFFISIFSNSQAAEKNFISTDPALMQGKKTVKSNCKDNTCSPYIYKLRDPYSKTVTYTDKDMSDGIFYVREKTIDLNDQDASRLTEFNK